MTPNDISTIDNVARETEAATVQEPQRQAAGKAPRKLTTGIAALAVLFGVITIYGIHSRVAAESRLEIATQKASTISVDVANPKPAAQIAEVVLPGTMQPFVDSPIYARTNGYLKRWYVDIGGRVKKGELLAEIETPELDQQLRQARAQLESAEANLNLSRITAERDQMLLKTNSVSTQERDNAVNAYAANQAMFQSNQANVARLEQLQGFEKVQSPFAGIITARKVDIGALIDAGANASQELFHIAAIDKLRVYVSVPEVNSRDLRPGTTAELTLDEFPGRKFQGSLVRTSDSIDYSSRTLLVEVDVDNPTRELMPGSYTQVHFKLPDDAHSLVIPVNAILFRKEGLEVGIVRNGKANLVAVTPGHDYGDSMEVLSGLEPNDAVILNPPDSLTNGTPVQVPNSGLGVSGQ
jgi:RND family efflux transporter MFP subunit